LEGSGGKIKKGVPPKDLPKPYSKPCQKVSCNIPKGETSFQKLGGRYGNWEKFWKCPRN